ncbi:MAG: hypothetical protein RLZZ74_669 [Cyanobacteriota bacterium]|jgi:hypothetical protein
MSIISSGFLNVGLSWKFSDCPDIESPYIGYKYKVFLIPKGEVEFSMHIMDIKSVKQYTYIQN